MILINLLHEIYFLNFLEPVTIGKLLLFISMSNILPLFPRIILLFLFSIKHIGLAGIKLSINLLGKFFLIVKYLVSFLFNKFQKIILFKKKIFFPLISLISSLIILFVSCDNPLT